MTYERDSGTTEDPTYREGEKKRRGTQRRLCKGSADIGRKGGEGGKSPLRKGATAIGGKKKFKRGNKKWDGTRNE